MQEVNIIKPFPRMISKEETHWIGVALEFNIVVTGEDPKIVDIELQEAVLGYLESAKKVTGFRTNQIESLLNQKADEEYENKWNQATQTTQTKQSIPSPFSDIYKAGISNLATV
jgi:hypothetical protein